MEQSDKDFFRVLFTIFFWLGAPSFVIICINNIFTLNLKQQLFSANWFYVLIILVILRIVTYHKG